LRAGKVKIMRLVGKGIPRTWLNSDVIELRQNSAAKGSKSPSASTPWLRRMAVLFSMLKLICLTAGPAMVTCSTESTSAWPKVALLTMA